MSALGFSPLALWSVTPEELDVTNLHLRSWVSGEPRQDSTTVGMIFPVDFIIWYLRQFLAHEPGGVVLTGTPEGVVFTGCFPDICASDVVEIEGLDRQRQEVGQAQATRGSRE